MYVSFCQTHVLKAETGWLTFQPVKMTSTSSFFNLLLMWSKSMPCIKPMVLMTTDVNIGEKPSWNLFGMF